MGLETGTYPSFIGGVSQQDQTARAQTQVEAADNAWLHAAMGAGKRPGATFVQLLSNSLDPMSHFHSIVRDESERYIVAFANGVVRVFDHVTGREYTVLMADGSQAYLDTKGRQPWTVFKASTLADTTFIINRNVTVAMSPDKAPGYVRGTVQTMEDLPKDSEKYPPAVGSIYAITGTSTTPFDDYFVVRDGNNVWTEVNKPGIEFKYDKATMPHLLKRVPAPEHADGFVFSFGPYDWKERPAGDENTNPPASCVGDQFTEVFQHRNRVGFLCSENVLMTETDSPFQLFRTTVTQLLDTDPIDVAVNTDGVASLQHAVSFQSSVYLGSDRAQFLLSAEPYMAPKYVKTDKVNNYGCSPYIRPALMGDSMYFPDDRGAFVCLREYFMDDMSITGDAADVTAHVPRYLPGRVRTMCPAAGADAVFLGMDSDTGFQMYVYFVRWAGDEKQQSAWTRWSISGVGKVVHLFDISSTVYAVCEAEGGGCELVKFDMALNLDDGDLTAGYSYHLDRQATVVPVPTQFGAYTDITLPYLLASLDNVEVIKTDAWADPGAFLDLTGATLVNGGQTIRLPDLIDASAVVVGLNFTNDLTLTRPMIRQQNQAVLVGRLQVRDIEVAYKDATYFEVSVTSQGTQRTAQFTPGNAKSFTSRQLDSASFHLSSPTFHSGTRRFPVLANAEGVRITLSNRLPFQCWFQSAQWRGLFTSKSRV